jgi:hypothetical protein
MGKGMQASSIWIRERQLLVDNDPYYLTNSMTASFHHAAPFDWCLKLTCFLLGHSGFFRVRILSSFDTKFFLDTPYSSSVVFQLKKNFFEAPTVRAKKKTEVVKMKSHFFSASILK